jgi:hypothetical protein
VVAENVAALATLIDSGNGATTTAVAMRVAAKVRRDLNLMVFNT